jgi:hypothetical protein
MYSTDASIDVCHYVLGPGLGPSFLNNQEDLHTSKIYSLIRTKAGLGAFHNAFLLFKLDVSKCTNKN